MIALIAIITDCKARTNYPNDSYSHPYAVTALHLFCFQGVEGVSVRSLNDKVILSSENKYISFRDFLFHLSSSNNETIYSIINFLLSQEIEKLTVIRLNNHYSQTREPYNALQISVNDSISGTQFTHYLKSIKEMLIFPYDMWIFEDMNEFEFFTSTDESQLKNIFNQYSSSGLIVSELIDFKPLDDLLHFNKKDVNEAHSSSDTNIFVNNNSLASYLPEYTLPQVVALILKIDFSDITIRENNSYINNQSEYPDSYYHKFENLLQSYTASARNHQPSGINLVIANTKPFNPPSKSYVNLEETKTYVNLEQTTISRENLSDYFSTIGYKLNDLILMQEKLYFMFEEQEALDYRKRITELEQELEDEKTTSNLSIDTPALAHSDPQTNNHLHEELADANVKIKQQEEDLNRLNKQLRKQADKPTNDKILPYNSQMGVARMLHTILTINKYDLSATKGKANSLIESASQSNGTPVTRNFIAQWIELANQAKSDSTK